VAAVTLAIVHAASELTRRRNNAGASEGSQGTASDRRRTVAICAWILGMYAAIWLLGFSLATLITTVLYLRIARERWPLSVGLSLVGLAFVYGLFEKGLGVPFPPGQVFVWLGYGG
jgi:hypothetical protein